jgi:hypothetical protein
MKVFLLIFCLALAACDQIGGRYQMQPVQTGPNHEDKVWILDTHTGAVRMCYETAAIIKCLAPGAPFPKQ